MSRGTPWPSTPSTPAAPTRRARRGTGQSQGDARGPEVLTAARTIERSVARAEYVHSDKSTFTPINGALHVTDPSPADVGIERAQRGRADGQDSGDLSAWRNLDQCWTESGDQNASRCAPPSTRDCGSGSAPESEMTGPRRETPGDVHQLSRERRADTDLSGPRWTR
jgi:hypothetical protein